MWVLIIFIALVLYIIFYFMIVNKTENKTNKTENKTNRKYNACKKYNRRSYQKHNINRKKRKGDL